MPSSFSTGTRLFAKCPLGDRPRRALLARERQPVDVVAGRAFEGRDHVGAHTLVRLRVQVAQVEIPRVEHPRGQGRRERHHLDATGDHEILHAGEDARRREVHGRDARSAEAVERDAARPDTPAGVERRHPPDARPLLPDLRAAPPDHVVDLFRAELVPLLERAEHGRAEALRVQVRQGALPLLADPAGCADGVDDPGFSRHGVSSGKDVALAETPRSGNWITPRSRCAPPASRPRARPAGHRPRRATHRRPGS